MVEIREGDCLERLRELSEGSVDAIVTDPPYGLEFMGKEWDRLTGVVDADAWNQGESNAFSRSRVRHGAAATYGLPANRNRAMQEWHEAWAREALRVLKPGGHLLAFGGTRTYHRLACALEDAGFEIRDTLCWLYGSGFPKSLDVSKAIDKRGGRPDLGAQIGAALREARTRRGLTIGDADRLFCDGSTNWSWFEGRSAGQRAPTPETFARIAAAWSELAGLAEAVAERERAVIGLSEHRSGIGNGAGGHYTVGGTKAERVAITAPATLEAEQWQGWGTALKPAFEPIVVARKPLAGTVAGNVLAHGTGALNIDGCRIGMSAEDRERTAARNRRAEWGSGPRDNAVYGEDKRARGEGGDWNPEGRWPANVLLDEDAAAMLDEQTGELKSGRLLTHHKRGGKSQLGTFDIRDRTGEPCSFGGDRGGASRFFYTAKASRAERNAGLDDGRNAHPTVKPIDLMRWLVRLVTPPGGVVLDPFVGSGTTGCAAALEGFRFVGIERDAEYARIARARVAWWAEHPQELDTDVILAATATRPSHEQASLLAGHDD